MDIRDIRMLEAALDGLEELHDEQAMGDELVRTCPCSCAAAWRQARKVTVAEREKLGERVRLLDRV